MWFAVVRLMQSALRVRKTLMLTNSEEDYKREKVKMISILSGQLGTRAKLHGPVEDELQG